MQKQPLISINLTLGSYWHFIEEILSLIRRDGCSEYICVANAHMLAEAYNQSDFQEVVNNAVITTPDGVPLTWGLKLLHGIKQERVAGMDLLPDLLQAASIYHQPVFFYGGTPEMLQAVQRHIQQHYPGIPEVGIYSPPFRPLTASEEEEIISIVHAHKAKLMFVILGCPKQERWMASMKGRIQALMIGVGGALPVLLGMQKRAPKWMQDNGLEWLFRFVQEPVRLWKRYLTTNFLFISLMFREKVKQIMKNNDYLGKRVFDILFSSAVLLVGSCTILPLIAVLVKISSKGPVFFVQERTGLNNQTFRCYKFRSMFVNDESHERQAFQGDARITRIGKIMRKWNLDELPQFYNVLCGHMSVVGPRPHMLRHTEQYSEKIKDYNFRHRIRPGVTGWAQVNGLHGETGELWKMEERVKYDLHYIENQSFGWDLKIVWLTVFGRDARKNAV